MNLREERGNLTPRPKGWGARHTVAFLGFWSFAVNYAMRYNLALAIVAMVGRSRGGDPNPSGETGSNSSFVETCQELQVKPILDQETIVSVPEFNWTEAEQGFILGCFYWGYVVSQLPGGLLAQRYGPKWVLGLGLFITALLSFLIPTAARLGMEYLVGVRIAQGVAEGVTIPAMQVLLSKWLPPDERSKLASIAYSGISVGTAITMVTSGSLIETFGWPSVFYAIGGFTILWFMCYCYFIFDTPQSHPRISEDEAKYIIETTGNDAQPSEKRMSTPWVKIMTSRPCIAIFFAQTSNAWGIHTLLSLLPTYMATVLHFDMKQNSLTSASPHICMWLFSAFITTLADFLIQRKTFAVITMRKTCNTISQWGPALALIAAGYSGCDRVTTVILLNAAVGFIGAGFGGFLVNSIDIAPNHAGVIMGIGNMLANICGFAGPYVAGLLLSGNPSLGQWLIVFYIAAGIYFVGNLVYLCFASATEVSWNRPFDEPVNYAKKPRRFSALSESIQLKVG